MLTFFMEEYRNFQILYINKQKKQSTRCYI